MTSEAFEEVVRRALVDLRVADQVALDGVSVSPDSQEMTAELRIIADNGGDVRQAGDGGRAVTISVARADDVAQVESETRGELRRALRMCPLCQRIGHVEKLRNAAGQQEGCAVRCPACGEFEIDQESIRRFRSAWERRDVAILDRLPSLSAQTRDGSNVRITVDSWKRD